MLAVTDSCTPFSTEAILEIEAAIDRSKATAETYLRLFRSTSHAEAVQVAEAIASGEYVFYPHLVVSLEEVYRHLLISLPQGVEPKRILDDLYTRLYLPFVAAEVIA